ncbi:MAG: glucose-1-phosphate cytidylyltransferase [Lachnospiraceae bacterium]|nr:glucose-1-phosphate cytidylyltransferase [Lachnospiraceae bacterium]
MKVVILAGGFGTRISEESHLKPKPMIEIGDKPILWHIMKMYACYGYNEFVICCGYKQHVIKEWFADYYLHNSDLTFDFTHGKNEMIVHNNALEPWKVTLVDTGLRTMTGGRVRRVRRYLNEEPFLLTYGDGVADINVPELVGFHRRTGKMVTITSVQPSGRFGILDIQEDGDITSFREKKREEGGWINAGFMVVEPGIFDYIDGDETVLEKNTLVEVARQGQLNGYRHKGFWQCMDTLRERQYLESLWESGSAPWKIWD